MSQEVTTKQQAEARRRMLEAAVQQVNEALVLIEASADDPLGGGILYVNEAFTRLTGYSAEEVLGQTLRMLEEQHAGASSQAQMKQAFAAAKPFCVELLNYRKDGSAYWVESNVAPVFDDQEKLAYWVCVQRDSTARRKVEARARAQAALLEEARDAVYIRDIEGRLVYWNKSAERLFGWKATDAIEKQVDWLLFAPGDAQLDVALQTTLETGKWTGQLAPVSGTGDKVFVTSSWTLIPGTSRKPATILVVNTDITEKKGLEAQLLRAQRLESVGLLASGIAHDLNNVLNPIMIACDLLARQLVEERNQHLVMTISENVRRSTDILSRLLSFVQGTDDERKIIQPAHFIRNIECLIRETFPRSIKIKVEIGKDLWAIQGHPTELEQVLMNLSVNAADAMPEGGTLTITASNTALDEDYAKLHPAAKPGSYVAIKVSDTGEGIPGEIREKIFEPFFTTKKPTHGTGLGLSMVQRIVEEHGGFVLVYSEQGKGTVFGVFLPAAEAQPVQPVQPVQPEREALPRGEGEVILFTDDENAIVSLGKAVLERYGYQVLTARNGHEAVRLYRAHQDEIDLVVTDIMMPGMDGLTAIRALIEVNPAVKILATSGFVSSERLFQIQQAGAHTFLPKPFTMEHLLEMLHMMLRSEDRAVSENTDGSSDQARPPRSNHHASGTLSAGKVGLSR